MLTLHQQKKTKNDRQQLPSEADQECFPPTSPQILEPSSPHVPDSAPSSPQASSSQTSSSAPAADLHVQSAAQSSLEEFDKLNDPFANINPIQVSHVVDPPSWVNNQLIDSNAAERSLNTFPDQHDLSDSLTLFSMRRSQNSLDSSIALASFYLWGSH